jgi:DNA polymerase-3 subunit delta'
VSGPAARAAGAAPAPGGRYGATFAGLTGHPGPVRILATALASGRLPHALLFHGPAGVGKATAAGMLAAALLCTDARRRPCGACAACGRQAHGNAYDRVHLTPDGAQIKIEAVRALQDLMRSGPERAVAIVDPADAMNAHTANALLKTLEEPPPGWTLVLVTARPEALPATIRSRCQGVRFGRLTPEATGDVLRAHGVQDALAGRLARMAEGAPGALLGEGLDAPALLAEWAEAVGVLDPGGLDSPTRIFAAAEAWGREPERTRRFLRWVQMWVSEAAHPAGGAEPGWEGESPAAWGRRFAPGFLAAFTLAVQETEDRLERNVNRPTAIEALLVTLRGGLRPPAPARSGARP